MFLGLVCACASLFLFSAGTAGAVPAGSEWGFPITSAGELTVAPNGSMLDEECVDFNSAGSELWRVSPGSTAPKTCADSVIDSEGNAYIFAFDGDEEGLIESVGPSGAVRWSTPVGGRYPWRTKPVIGAGGSVYFSASNGSSSAVIGVDESTGAITLEKGFADVTGLYAYAGGLVVVNTDSQIYYLDYLGGVQHEYETGQPISAYEAYSSAGGADGAIFVAGYESTCGSTSHASVEKFTPEGRSWTWTDPAEYCSQTTLAATPDGGVVYGRARTNPSADYTSIGSDGVERWSDDMSGPSGTAEAGGYLPIWVAVNGVVALTSRVEYPCVSICPGVLVEYLAGTDGGTALPTRLVTGGAEGGLGLSHVTFSAGRTYLSGEERENGGVLERAVFAFPTSGLEKGYQLSLQEALTASGPPTPTPTPAPGGQVAVPGGNGSGGGGSGGSSQANPCAATGGSFVHRLLAGAKCTYLRNKLKAECAAAVTGWLFLPLKSLQAAKTAKGLLDLRKLSKAARPIGKLYNDLSLAKYVKGAPAGLRTPAEAKQTFDNIKSVITLVDLLPDLRKAVSTADFSELALDIADVTGLKPCVQGLADDTPSG
jgi:hypothetical protein